VTVQEKQKRVVPLQASSAKRIRDGIENSEIAADFSRKLPSADVGHRCTRVALTDGDAVAILNVGRQC